MPQAIQQDIWHYPRTELAKQVLGMFDTGLASSLTFFAPRRMGKTEFLRKDITPLAVEQGWRVFYFSFLDAGEQSESQFIQALQEFAKQDNVLKQAGKLLKKLGSVSTEVAGVKAEVNLAEEQAVSSNLLSIIKMLYNQDKPVLLLLDEIQALAGIRHKSTIAGLRTALDMHKDRIKVIFTGSSREGLRQMFSASNAPFFHYGQNLNFPELTREFTDHLAQAFFVSTQRSLDKDSLWQTFLDLQRNPQLARSLVERLALQPMLTIDFAKGQLIEDTTGYRDFAGLWESLKPLEKLLLQAIAQGQSELYGTAFRRYLAEQIGIDDVAVSSVQSALRSLSNRQQVFKSDNQGYQVEDLLFKEWILAEV